MPIDPKSLPRDAETLQKIVVDLAAQLDRSLAEQNKYQSLLRELLEAQRNRKSERLSKEQLALFEAAWQARSAEEEVAAGEDDDDLDNAAGPGQKPNETPNRKRGGRQSLARHLTRERIVLDLAEADKRFAASLGRSRSCLSAPLLRLVDQNCAVLPGRLANRGNEQLSQLGN